MDKVDFHCLLLKKLRDIHPQIDPRWYDLSESSIQKYFKQDFYVSSNNFSAYKLIESWPNWPGKWLNVFGMSGSGKTHLSKILEKKINKIKLVEAKYLNNKIIEELNKIDCLIIDNYQNNIDENLFYSILNQSKQLDNYIVVNSTLSLNELNTRYYDSIKETITLIKLENNGAGTMMAPFKINFNNAYPVRMGELSLGSDQYDTFMEFQVDFYYETYTFVG